MSRRTSSHWPNKTVRFAPYNPQVREHWHERKVAATHDELSDASSRGSIYTTRIKETSAAISASDFLSERHSIVNYDSESESERFSYDHNHTMNASDEVDTGDSSGNERIESFQHKRIGAIHDEHSSFSSIFGICTIPIEEASTAISDLSERRFNDLAVMSEEQSYSDTGHRSFDGIHALKASPNVEQDSARENDEQRRNLNVESSVDHSNILEILPFDREQPTGKRHYTEMLPLLPSIEGASATDGDGDDSDSYEMIFVHGYNSYSSDDNFGLEEDSDDKEWLHVLRPNFL